MVGAGDGTGATVWRGPSVGVTGWAVGSFSWPTAIVGSGGGVAGRSVLVVDDRVEARALVAGELEEAGFQVEQASDGEDAWRCFQRRRPDLVVSDLRMPRADGMD